MASRGRMRFLMDLNSSIESKEDIEQGGMTEDVVI